MEQLKARSQTVRGKADWTAAKRSLATPQTILPYMVTMLEEVVMKYMHSGFYQDNVSGHLTLVLGSVIKYSKWQMFECLRKILEMVNIIPDSHLLG